MAEMMDFQLLWLAGDQTSEGESEGGREKKR